MKILEMVLIYIFAVSFTIFGNAVSLAESKHHTLLFIGVCIFWGIVIAIMYYSILGG